MFITLRKGLKKYGQGMTEVHALDGMDFEMEQKEVCVVLGASGSGKTTLLNMIGGLDSLDAGELIVDGEDISQYNSKQLGEYRREKVSFVFQFYNLIPDLTVEENIRTVSDISGNPMDINEVMQAVGIDQLKERFPNELSGGQQQRVSIARALIKNPSILLCDELTGALDTKTSKEVLTFIQKVNRQFATTIIIITHNPQICHMADRIVEIKDGRMVCNELNPNKMDVEAIDF